MLDLKRARAAVQPTALVPAAWAAAEITGGQLGDRRRDQRLVRLLDTLAAQPTASVPQAQGSWAATKAAYRFLASKAVTPAGLRAAARPAVLARVAEHETVLVVQDTTSLNFSHHAATRGLGDLGNGKSQGLWVHSALAVSPAGVPLGVVAQEVWARDPATAGCSHQRRQRAYEDKESARWERTETASLTDLPATTRTVTVADREADIYEVLAAPRADGRELLIRATQERKLVAEPDGLWSTLDAAPVAGTGTVAVGRRGQQPPRTATVRVQWRVVTVRPPRRAKDAPKLLPVTVTAVLVTEVDAPLETTPLRWQLLTTLAVTSFAAAVQCARWYALRWLIERYHFVLKSGCRLEALQLETAERLERALAVYCLVAWRLLWLTYEARRAPEASCEPALARHEWQALYCKIHRVATPPTSPPTLRQAVRWVAQLGGFLARTHDGEPGVSALWRGWSRLQDIADTWLLLRPPDDVGNA